MAAASTGLQVETGHDKVVLQVVSGKNHSADQQQISLLLMSHAISAESTRKCRSSRQARSQCTVETVFTKAPTMGRANRQEKISLQVPHQVSCVRYTRS